jgi:type II restriction enzyme
MAISVETAKERLDYIIDIARVDLYKPIQIAEVLHHSRISGNVRPLELETYRNPSVHWRNTITRQLTGKISTSSARYQHDVWNENAMSPEILAVLDEENQGTNGAVERYVYFIYGERLGTVTSIITTVDAATPETFQLRSLLELFVKENRMARSIDKAYEIVAYSLFETIVTGLKATVRVSAPEESQEMLSEFSELAKVLLGLEENTLSWEQPAHVYRVGVTNSADRGLDMWANFGPVVQVKHLTLNEKLANSIIDQVESDHIVIVCRDADANVIQTIISQIGWGKRVRGVVKESDLIKWYERCLRGQFSKELAQPLLDRLIAGFKAEFPQSFALTGFLEGRGYMNITPPEFWKTETDNTLEQVIAQQVVEVRAK